MSLATLAKVVNGIRAMDVTTASAKLFVYLANVPAPGATVRGAADDLGLSKPTITRCMQQLNAKGWADQKPDPIDHRSVYIFLTRKGQAQADGLVKLLG